MKIKRASKRMQYQAKPGSKAVFFAPTVCDFRYRLKQKIKKWTVRGETKARVQKEEKRRYDDVERSQIAFVRL